MITITVLAKVNCHFCEDAEATLARHAPELGLQVEVLDLGSQRGRQLALGSGMLFPPGILIDGRPFSYGRLSEWRLRRVLKRHSAADPLKGGG